MKRSNVPQRLLTHHDSHLYTRRAYCPICGKRTWQQLSHMQSNHRFYCEKCGEGIRVQP